MFTDVTLSDITTEDAAIMESVGYGAHEKWDSIMSDVFLRGANHGGSRASDAARVLIWYMEILDSGEGKYSVY